ncbi:MAG TPA: PqiC family protein [Nevskiaceae bacterium]|nr:PqiC family protein [Nevskiaceae bacterium]
MSLPRIAVLILIAALLGGCASGPPLQFYTLTPEAGTSRGTLRVPIQIAAVHIPAALDRQALVRYLAPTHLQLAVAARWAGPLDEMIADVLTRDLQTRLGIRNVILPSAATPPHTQRIVVNILHFAPDASGTVNFEGSWSAVHNERPTVTYPLQLSTREAAAGSADEVQAQAMSRALGQVADALAAQLSGS